jgi:hypothetical protein
MNRSREITAEIIKKTNPDEPGVTLSPFSPGFDLVSFAGSRTQCGRDGWGNVGTKKCGRCNSARYCSKECQVADWKQKHRDVCQHPTADSTFIGEIPSSWTASSALAINNTPAPAALRSDARIVYDETDKAKTVSTPSIKSMASRPSLLAYLDHHSESTDGSFTICVANGCGAFISKVRKLKSPALFYTFSNARNCTILSLLHIDRHSI